MNYWEFAKKNFWGSLIELIFYVVVFMMEGGFFFLCMNPDPNNVITPYGEACLYAALIDFAFVGGTLLIILIKWLANGHTWKLKIGGKYE